MGWGGDIPAAPFIQWIEGQIEREGAFAPSYEAGMSRLASRLGVETRTLLRWRSGKVSTRVSGKHGDVSSETFGRAPIENALHRDGRFLWDVYPEEDFPELYPWLEDTNDTHAWCGACKDAVARGKGGRCLWCNSPTSPTPEFDWDKVIGVLAGDARHSERRAA